MPLSQLRTAPTSTTFVPALSSRVRTPTQRRWLHPLAGVLAVVIALPLVTTAATATIVERVVAVVGERAILLSDLRQRARPFLAQVPQGTPAQRAAQISQLMTTLLERMIDEELQRRAAAKAHVTVSAREIDEAIKRVAAQNGISVEELTAEAQQNGLSPAQYRQEIRRQLLDAKLMNVRLQGRVRVTEEDLRSTYQRLVMTERQSLAFRTAWIRIDAGDSPEQQRLARTITQQARAGADFAMLARRHSKDAATRKDGGLLPTMQPGQLSQPVDRAVLAMQVGEVSAPIRDGDDLVIVKLVERAQSSLPEFAEARSQLRQRVYLEKMEKARRHWLDALRRREHVETRL